MLSNIFLKDPYVRILIIITVSLILIMWGVHLYFGKRCSTSFKSGPYLIKKVIDGDTLIIENDEKVRLIGIDAPEIHHPVIPVQRFGQEAADFLKNLVENHKCTLEYEPDRVRDPYGRILAYVYVNGNLINAEMIRRGYAYAYTKFPFKRMREFQILEKQARDKKIGLWDFSLHDGRIANLVYRYDLLNEEGKRKLDIFFEEIMKKYSLDKEK